MTTAQLAPAAYPSKVSDFIALLKPRVMTLVVFTGVVGLLIAPGSIHPLVAATAVLCIALGSGASGAINMWYDRDIDAHMRRTQQRPIPMGKIDPSSAIEFGVVLAIISVLVMATTVNLLSAAVLATAILFYVFVYTIWLKRRTPQNIVIGGAAGAFPPVIGWTAVTNQLSLEPWVLFLIIFMWTPPHFWALSLYRQEDYAKAGIPMMPVVRGTLVTKQYIFLYTIFLLLVSLLPYFIGMSGMIYAAGSLILGGIFLYKTYVLLADSGIKTAPQLFGYSIFYLFFLFALLLVDHYAFGSPT